MGYTSSNGPPENCCKVRNNYLIRHMLGGPNGGSTNRSCETYMTQRRMLETTTRPFRQQVVPRMCSKRPWQILSSYPNKIPGLACQASPNQGDALVYPLVTLRQDFLELPTLGKLLDSKETSISYLLRAWEGKSKVKDHLERLRLSERLKPL